MVIISEEFTEEKIQEEISKTKEILDLDLPEEYIIDFEDKAIYIKEWGYKLLKIKHEIANFFRYEDFIIIHFKNKEDYEELKQYIEDSTTNFKIKIGDYY